MIFQCSDLDRALRSPELMPDARAHAEECAACRNQLYLWDQISRLAPQLRQDWESPNLWPRIQADLRSVPGQARRPAPLWRWALAAAATIVVATAILHPWKTKDRDFLTEDALRKVQQTEAAYAASIDKLADLAGRSLQESPAPLAAAYREKLVVIDSAIADLKADAEKNRYNVYVQVQLASLYREKQKTLEDWLEHAKRN